MAIRFETSGLTSYAGLELLRQFFARIRLRQRLRERLRDALPGSDYGSVALIMLVIAMLTAGARRVHQLGYLAQDPVIGRLCGLRRLPTWRSLSRWLGRIDERGVSALTELNAKLAGEELKAQRLRTLTIDTDGSVISTGLSVGGARRGYNPHDRKSPSYYPITAYEARCGLLLRCENRAGNAHDGKDAIGFLGALFDQIRGDFARPPAIEMRMDGAFFRRDVLDCLERAGAGYAIKVPFYAWLELKEEIAMRRRWRRIDRELSYFELERYLVPWDRTLRVVIYRRKVAHETRKNFQLDLFDPADGHYEYSAVTSNLALSGGELWAFMAGRGTHEKVYGELKNELAFDAVPSHRYEANSAWLQLNVMAFNLIRRFQIALGAPRRKTNMKRRTLFKFRATGTMRFMCFARAGIMRRPNGRAVLDVGTSPAVKAFFEPAERQMAV